MGKGKAKSGFKKVLLRFFFLNIMLTWKSVGVSKVLVLYVYIDNILKKKKKPRFKEKFKK